MKTLLASVALAFCACAPSPTMTPSTAADSNAPLTGTVSRADVQALGPWKEAFAKADVDVAAAKKLHDVAPGAEVHVFLGTWCGDSKREVSRFWKALDAAGSVPFTVVYVAVDRAKKTPDGIERGADLRFVPTFIVLREGREVGRVVESAPDGIESDLGAILHGECTGVVTGRAELGGPRGCVAR